MLENSSCDFSRLSWHRNTLEIAMSDVSSAFYDIIDLSPDRHEDFIGHLNDCESETRIVLHDITQALRLLEDVRSRKSESSGKSHKSRSSHGSNRSSSSAATIKAQAAAKAAALKAQLKYFDEETQQQAKLDKLRMLRDLEMEEAKVKAVCESLSGKSDDHTGGSSKLIKDTKTAVHSNQIHVEPLANLHAGFSQVNDTQTVKREANCDNAKHVPTSLEFDCVSQIGVGNKVQHTQQGVSRSMIPGSQQTTVLNSNAPVFMPRSDNVTSGANETSTDCKPSSNGDNFSSLLKHFGDFINTSRLPIPEPGIFTGDPLEYPAWRSAFSTLIECYSIPPAQRVHYLKRYLGGNAKKCVEGFLLIPTDDAYQEALNLIDNRFGDAFTVAFAFKSKIEQWAKIGARDAEGLRNFSDFLKQCEVAARTNPSLHVLNDDTQNRLMLSKLPDWIVSRWARQVNHSRERSGCFPSFAEFVTFLSKEADIACDPVTKLSVKSDNGKKVNHAQGSTLSTTSQQQPCLFCGNTNHSIERCFKFRDKSAQEKETFIKQKGICFGCLNPGHLSKSCKKRLQCKTCGKHHPTILHNEDGVKKGSDGKKSAQSKSQSAALNETEKLIKVPESVNEQVSSSFNSVSLMTDNALVSKSTMVIPIYVSHQNDPNHEVLTYALLDTQSDTSFVSDFVVSQLGIDGTQTTLVLSTMTSAHCHVKCKRFSGLQVRGHECSVDIPLPPVYSRDQIPSGLDNIPSPQMADRWPYLRPMIGNLMPKSSCGVGLLIGYNCPRALVPRDVIPPVGNGPFAQRTDLGWGIVGLISGDGNATSDFHCSQHICSVKSGSRIVLRTTAKEVITPQEILGFFGREEGYSSKKGHSVEDAKFLKIMQDGMRKVDGHFEMPLPFRNPNDLPANNKVVAAQRLKSIAKRFDKDAEFRKLYVDFMEDMFAKGHAEMVPMEEQDEQTRAHYLPHHGVFNESKPGKIRIVMDASARGLGKSLNDCLLSGPDLMNSLVGVLSRFRKEPIAFSCDIQGMFHQFKVFPPHRNFLRFLWYKDGDTNSQPLVCRSSVHLFGAVCSPAVAMFGLRQAALEGEEEFGPDVVRFIHDDFYVDDGLTSVPTAIQAIQLVKDSVELCARSGLKLHKFISNSREVINAIDKDHCADKVKDVNLNHDPLPIDRALGVSWCVESDTFKFRVVVKSQALTRRGMLSTLCSTFDPLGFIAPVVLQGKILLQTLCKDKLDWDDPLPDEMKQKWEKWLCELPKLELLTIDRCFKSKEMTKLERSELHCFSDASNVGYGSCVYLRLIDVDGNVHCSLVIGKSRVCPIKAVTIPRLELSAAVLSTEVGSMMNDELRYESLQTYYWTDSKIVLGFISNEVKRFQVYVANRVQRIRDVTDPVQWHYVSTESNPADLASRGTTADQLLSSMWLTGPEFLWNKELVLDEDEEVPVEECEEEMKVVRSCLLAEANPPEFLPMKYSSWNHSKRVLAVCLRFIENLRRKERGEIAVCDLVKAERILMQKAQQSSFQEEFRQLQSDTGHVTSSSCLFKLDPFVDEHGIIRVGGRIKESSLPFEEKHPVILPKKHFVSDLIVRHYHEKCSHQGRGMTMSTVRSHGIWILGLSSVVSSLIHKCAVCRKLRHSPQGQKMSDLPSDRLDPGPAFTHVAVDCFGPFFIKDRRRELKRYGILFTCLTSRAVYVDSMPSMDTDAFINALRRFMSVRGPIRTLRCDQGSNFMGGINQLKQAADQVNCDKLRSFLLENSCDFVVNAPHASPHGGVWERQIRSVRMVLQNLLGSEGHQLDHDGLQTLMYEAANIVNSRPLTTVNDPSSPRPITPNMLLTMKSDIVLPPPGELTNTDLFSRKRWLRVQYLANVFWNRWRKEFLHQLQVRQKWNRPQRNLVVGDIVLLVDESLPRCQWKLGRVTEVFPGPDGFVRRVNVVQGDPSLSDDGRRKNQLKVFERPVHKLILLVENS